jgi:hypothetical protein
MAFTLNYTIEEAQDATEYLVVDRSNWSLSDWGSLPAYADVTTTIRLIFPNGEYVDKTLNETEYNAYVSNLGVEIDSSFYSLTSFEDGLYQVMVTITGAHTVPNTIPVGFLAWLRYKARKLPLLNDEENLDFKTNDKLFSINMYLYSAEVAASQNDTENFTIIVNWINYNYNLLEITI